MDASDRDFHSGEQSAQQRWDTQHIWDSERRTRLLWGAIPDELIPRIEAAPFFFLATSNRKGECDCSFKGGGPGLIRVLDAKTFVFPDMAGNGAFMSLGNIIDNPHVGCLFIDFSTAERLRINGRASIHDEGELMDLFPAHDRVVQVSIEQVVPNCPAHIPKLVPAES